jgi:hypothetical protein
MIPISSLLAPQEVEPKSLAVESKDDDGDDDVFNGSSWMDPSKVLVGMSIAAVGLVLM